MKKDTAMKDSRSTFQMPRIRFECCCWILLLLLIWAPQTTASSLKADETTNLEAWQRCDYFVAPTSTGWGVYAGRSFAADEMVSLPTIFLPLEGKPQAVQHTVLDDYIYGVEGLPGLVPGFHSNVLFGPDMIYNHSPEPNVLYMNFGITTGFSARKDIREGEQLFTTYGDGTLWFDHRGIEMKFVNDNDNSATSTTATLRDNELPLMKHIFCSKIQVGLGTPGLQQLPQEHRDFLRENYDPEVLERLFGAPFDAKFDNARAKVPITKGERIELGVGLAMHAEKLRGSPLGALVIRWDDFSEEHQQILQRLRESGTLKIQTQSPDTNWKRVDETLRDWEDLAILPVSGGLIHVQRVGNNNNGNCRLVVKPAFSQPESVTVILELVATEDIALGEALAMGDVKPRKASSVEEGLLYQTLYQTSQL